MNAVLSPLRTLILPGGIAGAAHPIWRVPRPGRPSAWPARSPADRINPEALKYVNRLSDDLFVLGRRMNDGSRRHLLWRPGANW